MRETCANGCAKPVRARGLCEACYSRAIRSDGFPTFVCNDCGTELRTPAERCGFCIVEHEEMYA